MNDARDQESASADGTDSALPDSLATDQGSRRLENWRTFCAIEIPPAVRTRLVEHIKKLREAFPNIHASWIRDGRFHLTLKFIGDIPRARVDRLSLAVDRATNNVSPFNIIVEGSGAFPPKGPAKVLWVGINDPSASLARLQARLEDECAQEGFAKDERPFHPHLTLARLRKPQGARALAATHKENSLAAVQISVSELLVIRSELSSAGSNYTIISRHVFTGSAGVPPACALS